jgi:cell division protein FtsI/penicillin-binding protein 2
MLGIALSVVPVIVVFKLLGTLTNQEQVQAFKNQGEVYSVSVRTIEPARGEILDRWGHLLAANKTVYEVGVELNQVRNPESIALTMKMVLGLDYEDVYMAASQKPSPSAVYAVLANYVAPEQVQELEELRKTMESMYDPSDPNAPSLRGVVYHPRLMRAYPEKGLGSNILGFVSWEGKGYFGVEEKYNNLLAGKSKQIEIPVDPNQVEERPTAPHGASLVLTIDRAIQSRMEEILDDSIDETGAESGTIVVLDPKTGELLALATTPRLDLNQYSRYFDLFNNETPFNPGVSQAYEPGSVYKVLTMAAALDAGAVKPETTFIDTGTFEIGGTYIYNWNMGAWGPQDMQGCMQHSLNVCLAWVATQLGTRDFYKYMEAFGIGHLTGIDMAGEAAGRLKVGQGVSATPIQMASAISALANDGKIMAPHVVRSLINKGYQYDMDKRVVSTPLKPGTARTITDLLARSLETESSDALVTGYRVAGKTGTAEIPTPYGYTSNQTNASFVGWGPADDPQFLVYIWLEKPKTSIWGSVVAAPVFQKVVEDLVVLMDIPPDDVRHQLYGQ